MIHMHCVVFWIKQFVNKNRMIMYVALDIESFGPRLDDPVVAIGYVVGDESGHIKESGVICIEADVKQIEQQCYDQFWVHQQALLKRIQEHAIPSPDAWFTFKEWIDGLETKYPDDTIIFLSDNPVYDIGKLDFHLYMYTQRAPLRYTTLLKYRSIEDPSEQLEGWSRAAAKCSCAVDFVRRTSPNGATKDDTTSRVKSPTTMIMSHWPEDDARQIYELRMALSGSSE